MIKEFDIIITRIINEFTDNNKYLANFFKIITHTSSGNIYPVYALLLPFIFPEGSQIVKTGIIGFIFQVPIYIASKNLIQKERPLKSLGIKQIINPPDKYSFPSGHCASSLLLTLLATHYIPAVSIYFVSWTIIIFLSRVALGVHFLSDTIFGGLLGLLSFYIAMHIANIYY